jgi:hypothetical protein
MCCTHCQSLWVANQIASRCANVTDGLGKSTLANMVYTQMKTMEVFSKDSSGYVTFDLDLKGSNNAVITEVQRWLSRRKGPFLLVLDNVQHQHQLDSIINRENIRDKSFVLITSCRRDFVAPADLYDMPAMEDSDAVKLFQWHSQGNNSSGLLSIPLLKVRCSVQKRCVKSPLAAAELALLAVVSKAS